MAFYYDFPDAMAAANDHFFSRFAQAEVHTRNLPHWAANSTIIFITYRLADSMPADKLRQWQSERDEWLRLHPEPWGAATVSNHVHLLVEIANRDDLPKSVHGRKGYTAKRMNEAIGGSGNVWQRDYYEASSSSARVLELCCCSGESGLHKRLKFDKSSASTIIVMVCAPHKRCAPKRWSKE